MAAEIVGGGREPAPAALGDGLRGTEIPIGLDVRLWFSAEFFGNLEETDLWMIGCGDLRFWVEAETDAHFHIRLPRAEPDFADEHVL